MKRLIAAAFLALAAASAVSGPAYAVTHETGSTQAMHPTTAPIRERAAESAAAIRLARNTRPKRRARTVLPLSGQAAATAGNSGAQAAAQPDCSNQSHPDCPHPPTAPKSHVHKGAYNFTVEVGGY